MEGFLKRGGLSKEVVSPKRWSLQRGGLTMEGFLKRGTVVPEKVFYSHPNCWRLAALRILWLVAVKEVLGSFEP